MPGTGVSHAGARTSAQIKSTEDWQLALWRRWPLEQDWPGILDIYEAAAYSRVSPASIRRATTPGRDGRARLAHRRSPIRIRKADLDVYRLVPGW
jgi:hypothetical protein